MCARVGCDAVSREILGMYSLQKFLKNVFKALGTMGEEGERALAEGLTDSNEYARLDAAQALGEMGEAGARIVKARLAESDGAARLAVVEALSRMDDAGAAHAEAVKAVLKDSDWKVRRAAAEALCKMGRRKNWSELLPQGTG